MMPPSKRRQKRWKKRWENSAIYLVDEGLADDEPLTFDFFHQEDNPYSLKPKLPSIKRVRTLFEGHTRWTNLINNDKFMSVGRRRGDCRLVEGHKSISKRSKYLFSQRSVCDVIQTGHSFSSLSCSSEKVRSHRRRRKRLSGPDGLRLTR